MWLLFSDFLSLSGKSALKQVPPSESDNPPHLSVPQPCQLRADLSLCVPHINIPVYYLPPSQLTGKPTIHIAAYLVCHIARLVSYVSVVGILSFSTKM